MYKVKLKLESFLMVHQLCFKTYRAGFLKVIIKLLGLFYAIAKRFIYVK